MFRPFLPCGIAYGFAYALPMLCLWLCLWHSMLFFRRKASRRVVCIVPYRRGACQPVSAEFRRHLPFSGAGGCPRVGGGLLRRCRRPAGGVPCLSPAYPAFGLLSCPLSPQPPSPAGKGGGGMGAGKQTKGRVGGQQRRQATPADSGTARSAGNQPGKSPHHPRAAYTSSREAAVWAEARRKEG